MRTYDNLDAELEKAIAENDIDAMHSIMNKIGEIHKANCEELERVMREERITGERIIREAMYSL